MAGRDHGEWGSRNGTRRPDEVGSSPCPGFLLDWWTTRSPRHAGFLFVAALLTVFFTALLPVALDGAQAGADPPARSDRLWATAELRDGRMVEGFLVWDLNEATVWDLLGGDRPVADTLADLRRRWAGEGAEPRERSLEYAGVRLVWEEEDERFSSRSVSGVRFGRVASLTPEGDTARIALRSGEEVALIASSTDLGSGVREIRIERPGTEPIDFGWEELLTLRMGEFPPGLEPRRTRLRGRIETVDGRSFDGALTWDRDEAFREDRLDGREGSVVFGEATTIEKLRRGVRVALRAGGDLVLEGTNDVNDENRGILVSDPGLGEVSVPWAAFFRLDLAPEDVPGPDPSSLGVDGPLIGTVSTEAGEEYRGSILWDMDESALRHLLQGSADGLELSIEFSRIARVEKLSPRSARVTLRDGRSFDLEGSTDVGASNRGILVTPPTGDPVRLDWAGFRALTLEAPGLPDGSGR